MSAFQETLDYLYGRLPMYQRVGKSAFKKNLDNTLALLEGMGNPHEKLKAVHIAGTNGKGTSAHAIAAILQKAGYKTGLYTSPHLKNFTERIRINGAEIAENEVVAFVELYSELIDRVNPSFFEVTVAMAFHYFRMENVEIAVVETGLGGRLDSTNVLTPEVSLITTIGLDHTDILGDTIGKIAFEKAGIIKPRIPVVIGNLESEAIQVIEEVASRNESRLVTTRAKKHTFVLRELPPYFESNLPGILGVINELKNRDWEILDKDVKEGIENSQALTGLKGRFQTIQNTPKVIADVSHNADGLAVLFKGIKNLLYEKLHVIFGTVKDKPLEEIVQVLPKEASYYFTESGVPRSLPVEELKTQMNQVGLIGKSYPDVNEAKKATLAKAAFNDLILITGSTFVVAEIDEL